MDRILVARRFKIAFWLAAPGTLASFWRETSPKGAAQESPGRKPWEQARQHRKPRRGDALGAGIIEVPYGEHLSGVESEPPYAALSGLSAIWTLNPGLAPWAVLLDPFGVLGFAPETKLDVGEDFLGPFYQRIVGVVPEELLKPCPCCFRSAGVQNDLSRHKETSRQQFALRVGRE